MSKSHHATLTHDEAPFLPAIIDVPSLLLAFDAIPDIAWFEQALESERQSFRLQRLGILITALDDDPTEPVDVSSDAWRSLAAVLSAPCFRELETISVTFVCDAGLRSGTEESPRKELSACQTVRHVRVRVVEWDTIYRQFVRSGDDDGASWLNYL